MLWLLFAVPLVFAGIAVIVHVFLPKPGVFGIDEVTVLLWRYFRWIASIEFVTVAFLLIAALRCS